MFAVVKERMKNCSLLNYLCTGGIVNEK